MDRLSECPACRSPRHETPGTNVYCGSCEEVVTTVGLQIEPVVDKEDSS